MPSFSTLAIVGIPLVGGLASFLYPKLEFAGVLRSYTAADELNNLNCVAVPGLEACEDAWIHEASGLAYLPCSDRKTRQSWLPAVLHLNASAIAEQSTDYLALYDFNSGTHSKLAITNLPAEARGIYVHAIEVWPEEDDALTIFINSHRPPLDRANSGESGADSVIEIFETGLGAKEVDWVKTVKHELIRTPNNIAAVGPRQFYFSNDHKRKSHWSRKLEVFYAEPSDLVYCDASGEEPVCIVAASDVMYPNGIAKGPGATVYSASTLAGNVRIWEAQGDHTLVLLDEITVPRPIDNIHVAPTGEIFAATFPKVLDFVKASSPEGYKSGAVSPVEVWKVSNETSEARFYGGRWKVERVFADLGKTVSGATSAAPYKNKVLLTGVWTKDVRICELP